MMITQPYPPAQLLIRLTLLLCIGFATSTSAQLLQPPELYEPGWGSAPGPDIFTDTPSLRWSYDETYSVTYDLYVSQAPYGPDNVIFTASTLDSGYDVPKGVLDNGGTYCWYVITGDDRTSDSLCFTVKLGSPPPPLGRRPGDSGPPGPDLSEAMTFTWSSVASATGYDLNVNMYDDNTSNSVSRLSVVGLTGTSYTLFDALGDGNYWWTMTSFGPRGEGVPGDRLYFTIGGGSHPPHEQQILGAGDAERRVAARMGTELVCPIR